MNRYDKKDSPADNIKPKNQNKADHDKSDSVFDGDIDMDLTNTSKKESSADEDDYIVER